MPLNNNIYGSYSGQAPVNPYQSYQNPQGPGQGMGPSGSLGNMFQELNMNPMDLRELLEMERRGFQGPDMIDPREMARRERERRRERAEMEQKKNKAFGALGLVSPVFPLMNRLFSDTEYGGWGGGAAMERLGDSVTERMQASSALNEWGGNAAPTRVASRVFGAGGTYNGHKSMDPNTFNARADYEAKMKLLNDFRQRGREYWLQRMPNMYGNR